METKNITELHLPATQHVDAPLFKHSCRFERPDTVIEILGQKVPYPATKTATAAVGIVVAGIVLTAWILASHPGSAKEIASAVGVVEQKTLSPDGDILSTTTNKSVQFWTPSTETKVDDLAAYKGHVPEDHLWELKANDETAAAFGSLLAAQQIHFRRFKIVGLGTTVSKRGWWWIATVDADFDLRTFAKEYSSFYGSHSKLYLEIYSDKSQYIKQSDEKAD